MDAFGSGLVLGLMLSGLIGSTFFALLSTSISRGFRPALAMNLGVFLSDACVVILSYFFADFIVSITDNQYFRLFGALLFILFGAVNIFKFTRNEELRPIKEQRYIQLFLNGFLINIFNPSVIILWIGAILNAVAYHKFNGTQVFFYFTATLLVVLCTDIMKIYSAHRLNRFLKTSIIRIINIVFGLALIGLGIFMLVDL